MKTGLFTKSRFVTVLTALVLVLSYNACGAGMAIPVSGWGETKILNTDFSSAIDVSEMSHLQEQSLQILSQRCTSCHFEQSGPAGVFNLTDLEHLVQSGLVVPGHPDESLLLRMIETNQMPPMAPLSANEKSILRAWLSQNPDSLNSGSSVSQPVAR